MVSERIEDDVATLYEIARGPRSRWPGGSRHAALATLIGGRRAVAVRALRQVYVERYHRDPEIDLRGFGLGQAARLPPAEADELAALLSRAERAGFAERIEAMLTAPTLGLDDRRALFVGLARTGYPWGRAELATVFGSRRGLDLDGACRAIEARLPPPVVAPPAPPERCAAFFLSSVAAHLQELLDWALPLLDAGYHLQAFTPTGRAVGMQHDTMLPSNSTAKLGFGCPPHLRLDGPAGPRFDALVAAAVPAAMYDPAQFGAGLYGVGGLGTDRDLTFEPAVHAMVARAFAARVPILAVCHAPTVLAHSEIARPDGRRELLLRGLRAIGLPSALELYAMWSGRVAEVFRAPTPPIDVRKTLAAAGADVSAWSDLVSVARPDRVVRDDKDGVPVITGVGPLAARNLADAHLAALAERRR